MLQSMHLGQWLSAQLPLVPLLQSMAGNWSLQQTGHCCCFAKCASVALQIVRQWLCKLCNTHTHTTPEYCDLIFEKQVTNKSMPNFPKHIWCHGVPFFVCFFSVCDSPNKALAAEGFLLVLYRIGFAGQDLPSSYLAQGT